MKTLKLLLMLCAFNCMVVYAQDAKTLFQTGYDFVMNDNYVDGFKYTKKAADLGYAPAIARVGVFYEEGWCVPKDMKQAAKWYQQAADKGDYDGMFYLSRCYAMENNEGGVPTDKKKSFALCKKVYNKTHARLACAELAIKYYFGIGCRENQKRGKKLAQKAKDAGLDYAMEQIETLDKWTETFSEILQDTYNTYLNNNEN